MNKINMGMLDKISDHYKKKAAEDPAERFAKQVKGSFVSTAVIIGIVIFLIIIIIFINAITSLFN